MTKPSHPSWIGHTIGGRYQIEALLGQGGMSSVYRAVDPNLRRTVAIKLIHPHLSSDPEFVRRFEHEAAAVAQLRHPNIIQVYDFNHDNDVYYMVLEYVPGETLQSRLRTLNANNQLLPTAETVNIMATVCDAVAYAHEKGMIHRDLKPANVMLNPKDEPILMDFGVAKMLGTAQHTATGAIIGTAKYMSPEQAQGQRPDERTDVYSLGVMLYEMVTGATPFEGESTVAILMKHVTESPPDLRRIKADIPDSLAAIIEKALEKKRERRFQTVADMAAALRAVDLNAQPTAAPAPPPDGGETVLQTRADLEPVSPPPSPAYAPVPPSLPAEEKKGGLPVWLIGAVAGLLVLAVLAGAVLAFSSLGGPDEVEAPPTATAVAAVTDPTATPEPPSPTPAGETGNGASEIPAPTEPPAPVDTDAAATAEAAVATDTPAVVVDVLPTDTPTPTPTEPPPSPTPEPSPTPTLTPTPAPPSREGMRFIAPGFFQMGSATGQPNERPEHPVLLDGFFIDTTEVSNAQYRQCVNDGGCTPANTVDAFTYAGYRDDPTYNNYPVISVTWDQAQQYCRWAGKRLPTEAEWEYAASGPDNRTWPWGNSFDPALTAANSPDVQPVTSFPGGASPFGALNMAGNVNEWVADVFSESFYGNSPASNPVNAAGGDARIFRGGSFANADGSFYTTSRRYNNTRSFSEVDIGFRCAADAPDAAPSDQQVETFCAAYADFRPGAACP